jgi:hypothetical protein
MPDIDAARRRLPGWAIFLVVVMAVVACLFSTTFSIAHAIVATDPERAHAFAPSDARIAAALSVALSEPNAKKSDRQRSEVLARLALRQDLTAVSAVSTLGINAELRGDVVRARNLFAYARKLSRRDIRTQLWTIEDFVRRNDVPGALRQYDITLRVFPQLSELLYPVLSTASADSEIRAGLVAMLRNRPPWGDNFLVYTAASSPDARATAGFLTALSKSNVPVPDAARSSAVNAMLAKGYSLDAWTYYASIRKNVDRSRSRDPGFRVDIEKPSQFDWLTINEGTVSATLQPGSFDFAVPASVGGPLLQQFQMFLPGTYSLMGHSIGLDQPARSRPYWVVACQEGRELGRVIVPNSTEANGRFAGSIVVPADCPVQTLTFVASPSDAVSGLSGQIDHLSLSRVENSKQ